MMYHLTNPILLLYRGGVKCCEKCIGILEFLELTGVRKFQCIGKHWKNSKPIGIFSKPNFIRIELLQIVKKSDFGKFQNSNFSNVFYTANPTKPSKSAS